MALEAAKAPLSAAVGGATSSRDGGGGGRAGGNKRLPVGVLGVCRVSTFAEGGPRPNGSDLGFRPPQYVSRNTLCCYCTFPQGSGTAGEHCQHSKVDWKEAHCASASSVNPRSTSKRSCNLQSPGIFLCWSTPVAMPLQFVNVNSPPRTTRSRNPPASAVSSCVHRVPSSGCCTGALCKTGAQTRA